MDDTVIQATTIQFLPHLLWATLPLTNNDPSAPGRPDHQSDRQDRDPTRSRDEVHITKNGQRHRHHRRETLPFLPTRAHVRLHRQPPVFNLQPTQCTRRTPINHTPHHHYQNGNHVIDRLPRRFYNSTLPFPNMSPPTSRLHCQQTQRPNPRSSPSSTTASLPTKAMTSLNLSTHHTAVR